MNIAQWIKKNSIILFNTGSLVGTMLVTSVLGFAYWLVADRIFPIGEVGLASAATSAMMLLSTLFLLGQGTLLITELPRNEGQKGSLISASLLLVGGASMVGGIIFAALTPLISPQLVQLGSSPQNVILFAFGVVMAATTYILDQAVIGLLFGGLQLWRNTLFSVAKLAFLIGLGMYFSQLRGVSIGIYTMWTMGNVISLVPVIFFLARRKKLSPKLYIPQWQMMRKLGRSTIQHHVLNLILQAPTQALPIIVTILLSAKMNAWFYTASMMANFIFSLSQSLTTVLHAANASQSASLTQKTRLTIGLSFLSSLILGTILIVGANFILQFFGASYAQNAASCLRILVLAAVPLIIKNHFIAINRIKDHVSKAIVPVSVGAILELAGSAVGAHLGGLDGLSLGWVIAMVFEALFMTPVVLKTLLGSSALDRYLDQIATAETMVLPALNQFDQFQPSGAIQLSMLGNTFTLTELDTIRMPVIRKPASPPRQENRSIADESTITINKDQFPKKDKTRGFKQTVSSTNLIEEKEAIVHQATQSLEEDSPVQNDALLNRLYPRTYQKIAASKWQIQQDIEDIAATKTEPETTPTDLPEQLDFPEMPTVTRQALEESNMPYHQPVHPGTKE